MSPVETFNVLNLGWPDVINLTIRILVLFILGITSRLTLEKKFYQLTVFIVGVWLTFFRLTLLRAILLYVGVFKPEATNVLVSKEIYNFLQSIFVHLHMVFLYHIIIDLYPK